MQSQVSQEGKRLELQVVEERERGEKGKSKALEGSSVGCKDEEGQVEEGQEVGDQQLDGISKGLSRVGIGLEWVVAQERVERVERVEGGKGHVV